ncbi:hypothetical protein GUITHDRAFT_146992 [Guillardia theta CCMP2712]|uniref:Uncharacterized protein n=1 Tax=Guillardia theta (strain CCMP2712) TaxID=905079 RepID=L1IEX2_GUITC|nr:hypothetical protein GUITHDRAFT_146992 [Guillardia theta CCMP2712]EKX34786.1 hypothetical protein GUITHDRAFT_146992 [Guillardia theta CCMP2712]|eukprot:XP_005821766.1 hypothetical protein GUITHDRAFT_146992 [Guillardia theta CCMP2712]
MCRCAIAAVLPLSIVNMVLGLGLLIAGIVAATYKIPNTCNSIGSGYNNNKGSFNSGFNSGFTPGYNSGYAAAYSAGAQAAYNQGYHAGFNTGFNMGYCSGYSSSNQYYYTGQAAAYNSAQTSAGYIPGTYSSGLTPAYASAGYYSAYQSAYATSASQYYNSGYYGGAYSNYQCEAYRQSAQDVLLILALMGTIPVVFPLVFGCVGILTSIYKSKIAAGVNLTCLILGTIASTVGVIMPTVLASTASAYCSSSYVSYDNSFCGRYVGSTWAIASLNIILSIYQLAFSIVMCGLCCQPEEWEGSNSVAAEGASNAMPIAQVAGTLPSAGGHGVGMVPQYPQVAGLGGYYPHGGGMAAGGIPHPHAGPFGGGGLYPPAGALYPPVTRPEVFYPQAGSARLHNGVPNVSSLQQQEADYEMALKIQREEERRMKQGSRGTSVNEPPHVRSSGTPLTSGAVEQESLLGSELRPDMWKHEEIVNGELAVAPRTSETDRSPSAASRTEEASRELDKIRGQSSET